MTLRRPLPVLVLLGLLACEGPSEPDDGDQGLRVTSLQPAHGADDVPLTTAFAATLNENVDPATVGSATVALTLEGTQVPTSVSYEAASRTIRLIAPLLPGRTYRAALGSGIRSLEGDSLAGGREWNATTRDWNPVVLSTVGVLGAYFDLAVGPSGSLHLLGLGEYTVPPGDDSPSSYLKYVSCSANCSDPGSWGRIAVDSAYPGAGGGLQVDQTGAVHVLHLTWEPAGEVIRYGRCPADCLTAANWSIATVESFVPGERAEGMVGFVRSQTGRLHLVTSPSTGGEPQLRYASCDGDCTEPANWTSTLIPVVGYPLDRSALQLDGTGGLHLVTYYGLQGLSYATCPSDCHSPARWTTTVLEQAGGQHARSPSYVVDAAGRVHLLYTDQTRAFTYARCETECDVSASWQTVRLDQGDSYGSAIVVDADGRITALNPVSLPATLRFLTCAIHCLEPHNWQVASVERPDIFQLPSAGPPRLALGPGGRVRMIYTDTMRELHYLD